MNRIDTYPTHSYKNFKLHSGRPYPFGATLVPGGVNFSVFSSHATSCKLVLFEKGQPEPMAEIPFPEEFCIGHVFTMIVFNLDYENIEYGFRMEGPFNPKEGHRFDSSKILLDPYAKAMGGREVWGIPPNWEAIYPYRARLVYDDFDWELDQLVAIPAEDLIIYEMHVRGFTQHPSSGVKHAGTYAGIREKIPYLKELGINCVELMPIFEFDEFENDRVNPKTGESLLNYWGYSTVNFFAPKAGYAATGKFGMQIDEFKNLVKELHKNGIRVILDVVFNHTAEGNAQGHTFCFRGIDNKTYYMLTPEGHYFNFSGCGNTLNCNNPVVRNMVLDCLRYWVAEYHIDGFRFDLASILGRDTKGTPLANPPLLETLAFEPVLAKCELIAEAWDAGGLYQVGSFPAYGRWGEWNGKYRDCVRKFLRGDDGQVGEMVQRVQGSPDLYPQRGTTASINFITCHDGFTLADLFSYHEKHNRANGENNQDGTNDNFSANYGCEGPTNAPNITALRHRQIKNAIAILMVSQGAPMILMGDEVGRTQGGNNNAYCQDNELNWLDWSLLKTNADIFRFFKYCIAFRKAHPVLRSRTHFRGQDYMGSGTADITWHGLKPWSTDWANGSHTMAFMLCGKHAKGGTVKDNSIYVAFNMHRENLTFNLPQPPKDNRWHVLVNTGVNPPEDIWEPGHEPLLPNQSNLWIGSRAVVILVAK